jgi:sulfur carrier protein ThiS adenylyltransferase
MTFGQIKEVLQTKTVGIAGAGGLGSNCAVALARVGIGRLIIADFDVVSEGNLNRQYYFLHQTGMKKVRALSDNIRDINPATRVEAHDIRLTAENIPAIFAGCDVIVEAFDLAEMKHMIIETVLEKMKGIPLVSGIGLAGFGNSNNLQVKRYGNLYVCGDETLEVSDELPPLAPRMGIVAGMQANTVLEILLKPQQP